MDRDRPVTMTYLARLAGVSVNTVRRYTEALIPIACDPEFISSEEGSTDE